MKYTWALLFSVASIIGIALVGPSEAHAAANDFSISNYQIDYYLNKTDSGQSTLKTIEKITAEFPQIDQNHGIERAVPNSYDSHTTHLHMDSITDASGRSLHYATRDSNDNTVYRIGDANTYVHGPQTYVLTYTQRDVTKYFPSTNDDEFYWDTNGTEWAVPIAALGVHMHVSPSATPSLNGKQACYVGSRGSSNQCSELTKTSDGFSTSATNLGAGENVTVSFGFQPYTFAAYSISFADSVMLLIVFINLATAFLAVGIFVILLAIYRRKTYRTAEIGFIAPEYIPPRGVSVSVAASISRKPNAVLSAQLIDLCVRHYLKITEVREKKLFKPANYELEIIKDPSDLLPEEFEVINDLFELATVGDSLQTDSLRTRPIYSVRLRNNAEKVNYSIAHEYALRAKNPTVKTMRNLAIGLAIIGVLTLSVPIVLSGLFALILHLLLKPLTDKGLELARYLKGLDLYIRVAEEERIHLLQSPEGAKKIGSSLDPNDKQTLITLYERVLPYAILFGREKDWNERLGKVYEETQYHPGWYQSTNGASFNAFVLGAAISSFMSVSQSIATFNQSSSSGFGGSGGGGFSGGGGGGGGGGGW